MAKYIIFDFDGTLANSLEMFIAAYNDLAAKEGYRQVAMEDIDHLSKMTIPERCHFLNFPMRNIPFAAPKLYRYIRKLKNGLPFYPGIKKMLDELKQQGFKVAIISSNATDIINRSLEAHQVDYVDDILCSKYIFSKDKLMKKLMNKYKMEAADALYVGDEERDITASKKAGMKVVWAAWGYDDAEIALKAAPDFIAHEPADILKIAGEMK
ncbi:HAD-IA family hydrolase [Bacillus aerolatus]|uniref:HAD-IA family hydrolase n=1 Tax=Bacillus aerolatus TaxID=2653354 RepID=A0A6I1FIJ2_9BACI|nr:HAD-IA family hydrolase [Bacillus aerolatus]KAB7708251.1 HAD-IA family hydrolase [Bacillus aerolatus]